MVTFKHSRSWIVAVAAIAALGLVGCASAGKGMAEPQGASEYEISLIKDTIRFRVGRGAYEVLKTAESLKGLNDAAYMHPSDDKRAIFLLTVDADADSIITLAEAKQASEIQRKVAIQKYSESGEAAMAEGAAGGSVKRMR